MTRIYTQNEIDWMESTDNPANGSLLYKGLLGIRKCGITMELSDPEIVKLYEYERNPIAFIHNHGIAYSDGNRCIPVLYQHQEEILVSYRTNRLYPILLERQSGLTSVIQFMALHELVFSGSDIVICCSRISRSADIIDGIMDMYAELPFYMKPGVESMETLNIKFENGGRITACPLGKHIGRNIDSLYIDDFQDMGRGSIDYILNQWLPQMLAIRATKIFIGCSGSIPPMLSDTEFFNLFKVGEIDWVQVK